MEAIEENILTMNSILRLYDKKRGDSFSENRKILRHIFLNSLHARPQRIIESIFHNARTAAICT